MTAAAGSILITGASGRLGRVVSQAAVRACLPTVLWNRRLDSSLGSSNQVHADITSTDAADRILSHARADTVIHLAAITGAHCEQNLDIAHGTNVIATERLAQAAALAGVTRFVFASTAAVYGDAYSRPILETDSLVGRGNYAATKIAAEASLASIGQYSGMEVVVLRIFNVYGEGFHDSLIYRLQNASVRAPVTLRGEASFVRDYVNVEDVATACIAACKVPMPSVTTVINVGTGVPTSNADLFAALDVSRRPHVTAEPGAPSHSQADVSRMREILGVTARTRLPLL